MNTHITETVTRCAAASEDGTAHFGQIVGMLASVGVESYQADYRARRSTYYWPNGESLTLDLAVPELAIGEAFDTGEIQSAIRGAQRGEVMYPAFKRLSMAAGCTGYTVWIAGRHVSYFGRRGETHVERFPD